MRKRKTEAEKKAALLQRVLDIYCGAAGGIVDPGESQLSEVISRVMNVVRLRWAVSDLDFMVKCFNVDQYDNPEKAADFLYRNGVRA
jgi:hypothetical protein